MKRISVFKKAISVCLAVVLLCVMLPLSASAVSYEKVYCMVLNSDKPFDGTEDSYYKTNTVYIAFEADEPLKEQDVLAQYLDYEGGDIVGWKLWGRKYSGALNKDVFTKIADLGAGFSFAEYTDEQLDDIENQYDHWFLEPIIEIKYWFTNMPTAQNPSFSTNKPATSLQWYQYTPAILSKTLVDTVTDAETQIQYADMWEGEYVGQGRWKAIQTEFAVPDDPESYDEYVIDMAVILNEGDTLKITVSDGFDGDVHEYYEEDVFTKNGNVYTYVNQEDGYSLNFYIHNASTSFTADICVDCDDYIKTAISGQTAASYTGEGNQMVACYATFENGKYVVKSDAVELGDYWIISQPTEKTLTVETNKPAKSYQWYSYKTQEKDYIYVEDVTDNTKELAFDDVDLNQINSPEDIIGKNVLLAGAYDSNGFWKVGGNGIIYAPNQLAFIGYFAFDKGDKFKVEVTGADSSEYELQIAAMCENTIIDTADIEKDANGNYIVPEETLVFGIGIMTENQNAKVKVTRIKREEVLTAVDGQTAKTFTGEAGVYVVKATYADGTVLTSDVLNYANIPPTGDNSSVVLWLMMAVLSLAVLSGTLVYAKKVK